LSPLLTRAQRSDYYTNYQMADGLSDDRVTSIYQDHQGFIWIGTTQGLDRFDGKYFKNFSPNKLVKKEDFAQNTLVYFESKPNELICRFGNFAGYIFQMVEQKVKKIKSLENKICTDFYRLSVNTIGVSLIDTVLIMDNDFQLKQQICPPFKKTGFPTMIRYLNETQYLVFNRHEFFIYEKFSKKFQRIPLAVTLTKTQSTGWTFMHFDQLNQELYLSNYFLGLIKFSLDGSCLHRFSDQKIGPTPTSSYRFILNPARPNEAYLAGEAVLTSLNLKTNIAENIYHTANSIGGLNTSNIYQFLFDKTGTLWMATENGLFKKNDNSSNIESYHITDFPNYSICSITKGSDGKIYSTFYLGKVYQIDPKTKKKQAIYNEEGEGNWFVLKNGDEIISGGGNDLNLNIYNTRTRKKSKSNFLKSYFPEADVVVLGFRHSNGDIWYSGNQNSGLIRVHKNSGKISAYNSFKGDFFASYFSVCEEDENGNLWFGSNKSTSLFKWDIRSNTFVEIRFKERFSKRHIAPSGINSLVSDKKGGLWIGFDGSGLVKYDISKDNFEIVSQKNGLPSNHVYSLALDQKNQIWVGTNRGMACYNTITRKISIYTLKNALLVERFDNNAIFFDKKESRIWIAAMNTVMSFNPDKLGKANYSKPKLYVDEFLVNNENRLKNKIKNYVFDYLENNLQIRFGVLSFAPSIEFDFSYQFVDDKKAWVELGNQSQINFANLNPGQHTLLIRARAKGDTDWLYLSEPLRFEIKQIWYKTPLFIFLTTVLFSIFVFLVIRYFFMQKVEKQKVLVEKQKAIQMERDRIAFDMHDDLGSGLTRITYLSEAGLQKKENKEELSKIQNTSLELVQNMSELIWAMKAENDSLSNLQSYIKKYASEYLDSNNIDFSMKAFEIVDDIEISGDMRKNIYLIVKEALHNIVKHAKSSKVEIHMSATEHIEIRIKDNGIGFDQMKKSEGNGLNNMRKRTENLKGTFELNVSNGTEIRLVFPLTKL
jgi:signal transduction histidine kinase